MNENATPIPAPKATKVTGLSGRARTVWICYGGCWHNSSGQATKCKSARAQWDSACAHRAAK